MGLPNPARLKHGRLMIAFDFKPGNDFVDTRKEPRSGYVQMLVGNDEVR